MCRSPDSTSNPRYREPNPTTLSRRRFGERCLTLVSLGLMAGMVQLIREHVTEEKPKSAVEEFRDIMQNEALPRQERTRRLMQLFDARLERRDIGLSFRLHIAEQLMRDEYPAREIFHFLHACCITEECPADVRLHAAHLLDQAGVLYRASLENPSWNASRNARAVVDLACGRMEPQERALIERLAERIGRLPPSSGGL